MGKNLGAKTWSIVAILVIFIYGIFGIPHGGLKQSLEDRIHLGLDLKGGIHQVLRVRVAEALASTTDRDVQRIQEDLQKAGISGVTVAKLDPVNHPETITISNVPPAQVSQVRSILN